MNIIRAVGLLSGGLDSTLAAKLLIDQSIEVHAVNFVSPFCTCTPKSAGCASVLTAIKQLGNIPLKRIALSDEYLEIVRHPKHGHGRGMNPCIDCRIMKIRKAAEYMREIGGSFLFTGEVLGQRPMSQRRQAMRTIDKESGIDGLILRPLSARVLAPTIPEKNGWVNREALLSITGRSRKPQIALASQKGITDYRCSAGGCLLTDMNFATRLQEYFDHADKPSCVDIPLLKIGRHFRSGNGEKVIVARDEREGVSLLQLRRERKTVLAPFNFPAPVVLFEGTDAAFAFNKMLEFTKRKISQDAVIRIVGDESDVSVPVSEYRNALKMRGISKEWPISAVSAFPF
jgi:tRNA U34 2-thiouridine synthase MnmA/TrmU